MSKTLISMSLLAAFAAASNASISTSLVWVPSEPGSTVGIIDLQVTTVDDDWTAAEITATIVGDSTFYNAEDFNPPNPPYYGDPLDAFFTCPQQFPNGDAFSGVTFADGPHFSDQEITATWFDTNTDVDGTYTIMRIAFDWVGGSGPQYITLSGNVAASSTGGQLFPFYYYIPEPSCLALFGFGVIAALRRR